MEIITFEELGLEQALKKQYTIWADKYMSKNV